MPFMFLRSKSKKNKKQCLHSNFVIAKFSFKFLIIINTVPGKAGMVLF